MGNQQTNEIYKQYFNPQPSPMIATQEEPIDEDESRDDGTPAFFIQNKAEMEHYSRDQMMMQAMHGSFRENILEEDLASSINYNQSLINQTPSVAANNIADITQIHRSQLMRGETSYEKYGMHSASKKKIQNNQDPSQGSPNLKELQQIATRSNQKEGSPLYFAQQNHLSQCKKKVIIHLEDGLPDLTICIEQGPSLTCGWLINEVTRQYASLVDQHKVEYQKQIQRGVTVAGGAEQSLSKIKKKIIAAIKSRDNNESLDFWLTLYNRPLASLQDGTLLDVHFTKIIPNKREIVCMNDFQLLKVIGKGGFSKVLLVRKKDSGLLFAMKVMEKSFVTEDGKFRQVMCERNIMESLNHPFIVKLHWAFQSREELNFVMDLCAGGELFYLLHQRGKMNENQAKFYFAEILLGLEYIHSKGIVYRDLKPENVLLDIDGHIKLADFGLSKHLPSINDMTNSFCGSPEYMSPEMLVGQGHGFAVDYYSLGAILFEMLTGLPPFYSTDRNQMYLDIVEADLVYPDYLNPIVIDLLKRLLCKDQNIRYSFKQLSRIKQHPWCQEIQWKKLLEKQIQPPWLPDITKSNFDPDYTSLPVDMKVNETTQELGILTKGRRQIQRSIYCCIDNSAMTSFYDNTTIAENSGFLQNQHSCYYENGNGNNQQLMNMYSSRSKLLEISGNQSLFLKSPKTKEYDKALDQMFKGFSFYSEPNEEKEVQRQIREYLKMKDQMKRKTIQNKIKPQNYEELKQQARGEMPPKAQRKDNQQIKLNNLKTATQAIQQLTQQQQIVLIASQQQQLSPIRPYNLLNQIRNENSILLEEEISIAQEFSRLDDETDIDEQPKAKQLKINQVKINHTTENSLTRANQMTQKIFETYAQRNLSPSVRQGSVQTTAAKNNPNIKTSKKSNDNTPFNYYRKDTFTHNNSIISQTINNPDNSTKKPKFLQKFSTFLTNKETEKKKLLKDFSPIQAKQQSQIQVVNSKTFSSQWCSPNKQQQSQERNNFVSDYSYQPSVQNQNQTNNTLTQSGFSRNNSGGIGMSLTSQHQMTSGQRNSIGSANENIQNGEAIFTQPNIIDQNNIQSLIYEKPKSRNTFQNLENINASLVRSQENSNSQKQSQQVIQKQKTSNQLNLMSPFSGVDNLQQENQNQNQSQRIAMVQQSFSQKPPRQNISQNNQSGTLSRQLSINYGNNQNTSNNAAISSLTTYQRSKAALLQAKTFSSHTSLQRKQSNMVNNDSQISTNLINSNINMPLSNNTTALSTANSKKNAKFLSSTNVLSQLSHFDKTTSSQNNQNVTPKNQSVLLHTQQIALPRQLNNSLSQKRKHQQLTIQQQYLTNYSNSLIQNNLPSNSQISQFSQQNMINPKNIQNTGIQSQQYQSLIEINPNFTNEYQVDSATFENQNIFSFGNQDQINRTNMYKFTPNTTTNASILQSSKSAYRTFSKEAENRYNTDLDSERNQMLTMNSLNQGAQSTSSIISNQTLNSITNQQNINNNLNLQISNKTQYSNDMYYKRSNNHQKESNARINSHRSTTNNSNQVTSNEKIKSKTSNTVKNSRASNNENQLQMPGNSNHVVPKSNQATSFNNYAANGIRPSSGKNNRMEQRAAYLTLK